MRQRYYNPEIKRFVNQDILTGSLSNSQSLNQYSYVQGNPVSYTDPFGLSPVNGLFSSTNFAHGFFGLLSCIPGPVGAVASLADAAVYLFVDKDYGMAALCAVDALTFGMGKVAIALAKGGKMMKTAKVLKTSSSLISNATSFGVNAVASYNVGSQMYNKYIVQGQSINSSTGWEALALGLNVAGCFLSGKGLSNDTKQMGRMLQQEGVGTALKQKFGEFATRTKACFASNGGFADFSYRFESGSNAGSGVKKVPNPYGKKGCQAHRDTIASIQPSRTGGTMNYEKGFVTPKGSKSCRYADAVEIADGNIVAIHQVGKVNKNGTPVIRESRAIEDIMNSSEYNGAPIYFWPYNSDSGPIIYDF